MITKRQKQTEEFVALIGKLEAIEFLGVAKLLGVELYDTAAEPKNDGMAMTPREATQIIEETVNHFALIPKGKQRELLKVLRKRCKR